MCSTRNVFLQPTLLHPELHVKPLQASDYDCLYHAASDPLIWSQHPASDRHQRHVFDAYFVSAIACRGAFCIRKPVSGQIVGCTRYYELQPAQSLVMIGYTFLIRSCWGSGTNQILKSLMLDHAFGSVEHVRFHVGTDNRRSQVAMQRLGAQRVDTSEAAAHNPAGSHLVYEITRDAWLAQ
jgi:N-acetyltransferase